MRLEDFIKRTDELISFTESVLETTKEAMGLRYVNMAQFEQCRSSCLSFFLRVFGDDSPYYKEFYERVKKNNPNDVEGALGILKAVRNELEGGWLQTTRGLVSAAIFSDFIEMASYLLDEGYKDPSAVIIGSVLEEHLRQLCNKNKIAIEIIKPKGVTVTKKTGTINSDLAKANIYDKSDQKQVTAWLDLRNKAAHGRYDEYTKEQIALMLQGITNFMARNPV